MLFLIEYDRNNGKMASFRSFADSEKEAAETARLKLELELNRNAVKHEVVILEAASETAVRRTHRRYFENLQELLTTS